MRIHKCRWLQVILMCVLIGIRLSLTDTAQVNAQVQMDITHYDSQAAIQANGNVKFIDKITYDVDQINGVLFNLDYGDFRFSNYQVGMIDPESGEVIYFEESASGSPRTFFLRDEGNIMHFKVYYPVQDQVITFVYEYTLEHLVTNYQDVAQFNRKIIGSNWNEAMDVSAKVILPGLVETKEEFRAWGHGAPQGTVELGQADGKSFVEARVQQNPANTFLEINMLFPKSLTPNNSNIIDQPMAEQIMAEEAEQAKYDKKATQRYYFKQYAIIVGLIVLAPLFPLGAGWYYYRKRQKLNPHPLKLPRHKYDLPADITPAIMATAVYRKRPNRDDFTATIVDLARKGYLQLKEVTKANRGVFNVSGKTTVEIMMPNDHPDTDLLQRHELSVLRFLFPSGFHHQAFSIDELIKEVKAHRKLRQKQYSYYQTFLDFAAVNGEKLAEKATVENQHVKLLSGLGLVINLAIAAFTLYHSATLPHIYPFITGIACIMGVISLVLMILTKVLPIRSATEDRMRKEWRAFEQMLADISQMNMREIASLELWQTYLVYAISLGLADKVIEAIKLQFPAPEVAQYPFIMTYYNGSPMYHDLLNDAIASSIKTATPTQTYSGSNSSGFGGGFSGGSSGGSGGGSGGGAF